MLFAVRDSFQKAQMPYWTHTWHSAVKPPQVALMVAQPELTEGKLPG